jgi:hypothetical protein
MRLVKSIELEDIKLMSTLTENLRELMARVGTWPEQTREELVRSGFDYRDAPPERYELTEEDRAALERSFDDVSYGRFASDEQMAQVFARCSMS